MSRNNHRKSMAQSASGTLAFVAAIIVLLVCSSTGPRGRQASRNQSAPSVRVDQRNSTSLRDGVAAIEEAIETERRRFAVPGVAVGIVTKNSVLLANIVERYRRERVSQLAWCGEGCFDSCRRVNSTVMLLTV